MSQRALTAQDGTFTISQLPPGTYQIDVEVPGFKRLTQTNVQISASSANVNLTLEAGSEQETVTVEGMTGLTQSESAEIGRSYDTRFAREVPLQQRDVQQNAGFMPGVTLPVPVAPPVYDPQRGYVWNTNGQRAEANRNNLDGIQNDEPVRGAQVHQPTLEGVAQFNISTSNYDVSNGRAAGSITNAISGTGTNTWNGSAFAFNDNSWAAARNYFNPVGYPQSQFNNNQFGASIGGPIIHDKTFFFGSWESDYLRGHNPTAVTVPWGEFSQGNFSGLTNSGFTLYDPITGLPFANNKIPASRLNPIATQLLSNLPQQNAGGYEYNYFANPYFRNDNQRFEARVDHRFNQKAAAYLRYGYTNGYALQQSPYGSVIGASTQGKLRSDAALAGFSTSFSPSLVTDLRVGYNRYDNNIYSASSGLGAAALGFTGPNGGMLASQLMPAINIAGLEQFGDNPNYPQRNVASTLNIANSWSKRMGRNDIRFGVDLYGIRADGFQNAAFGPQGGYFFGPGPTLGAGTNALVSAYPYALASFLLGTPTIAGAGSPIASPSVYQYQYAGYIGDRIQILPKVTVDLGLRYEFFDTLRARNSAAASIFDPGTNQLVPLSHPGIGNDGNVAPNFLNFAPRVGLAISLTDRTVIRGGYGIEYFPGLLAGPLSSFIYGQTGAQLGFNGALAPATTFGEIPAVPAYTPGQVVPAANIPFVTRSHGERTPYTQSYSLGVQQDFGNGILAEVAYVGNVSRFLPYMRELNAGAPGTSVAGLPYWNYGRTASTLQYNTGLTSNFNSLQVNVTKRFAAGLAFTAAYTYGKSLDYASNLNPINLNGISPSYYYGPSDFDRTHMFTLTHVWQLPIGTGGKYFNSGFIGKVLGPWEINGVLHGASGLPYTPTAELTGCQCPNQTVRADVVANGSSTYATFVPGYYPFLGFPVAYTVQNYALQPPAPGTIGTAGRNILRGPNFWNYDLSLFRSFVFLERTKLEFRAEAYNIANTPHFAAPNLNVNSPFFGESTSMLPGYGNRTLQLALRLVF